MNTPPTTPRVDFSYAFSTPHRLTAALPDSSDKTLLDLHPGWLRLAWTYDDLTHLPLAAFVTPQTTWEVHVQPLVDGQALAASSWQRLEGWLPALDNRYTGDGVTVRLEVAAGATAALTRITLQNSGDHERRFTLRAQVPGQWAGYLPAWVDRAWDRDVLLAGWKDRADRVVILAIGADDCDVSHSNTLLPAWRVRPGETRTAWLVRPYRAYARELPDLRTRDWPAEFAAALETWRALRRRCCALRLPDAGVENAFYACIADLFVMREPVAGGYIAACPGTECYRAPNAIEAGIVAVALDQVGLHAESALGYQLCLDLQGADGDWADPEGWCHQFWASSGFKSWAAMEHYRHTRDRQYLEAVYPRMLACSRWQETQRRRMRTSEAGERPLTYGLMPRGMGDAGLKDDEDLYGVFLPHNIWAVYHDKLTVEAAELLGRAADLAELRRIRDAGLADLLAALDRGAIREQDYRWIPAVAGKTCGSRWGALNAAFPCGILPSDHELISGTIRQMESRLSAGGLPIHTGWLAEGMWVAITLDNLAEVHLQRNHGDAAAAYLYATLNHGTPLYTWCEERGQAPGTTECTGDRQHLWTPVAVVRALRDCLVMEDGNTLHLCRGTERAWLTAGPIGLERASTHFGDITFELRFEAANGLLHGEICLPDDRGPDALVLHVRLPEDRVVRALRGTPSASVSPDGSCITWDKPRGRLSVVAETAARAPVSSCLAAP